MVMIPPKDPEVIGRAIMGTNAVFCRTFPKFARKAYASEFFFTYVLSRETIRIAGNRTALKVAVEGFAEVRKLETSYHSRSSISSGFGSRCGECYRRAPGCRVAKTSEILHDEKDDAAARGGKKENLKESKKKRNKLARRRDQPSDVL